MHLSGWAGEVEGWQGTVDNDYIKEDFGLGGLLKMGTEVKITPQFAIRAGGAWQHSPAKYPLLVRILHIRLIVMWDILQLAWDIVLHLISMQIWLVSIGCKRKMFILSLIFMMVMEMFW